MSVWFGLRPERSTPESSSCFPETHLLNMPCFYSRNRRFETRRLWSALNKGTIAKVYITNRQVIGERRKENEREEKINTERIIETHVRFFLVPRHGCCCCCRSCCCCCSSPFSSCFSRWTVGWFVHGWLRGTTFFFFFFFFFLFLCTCLIHFHSKCVSSSSSSSSWFVFFKPENINPLNSTGKHAQYTFTLKKKKKKNTPSFLNNKKVDSAIEGGVHILRRSFL